MFVNKILKDVLFLIVLAEFATGSYTFFSVIIEEIYGGFKAPDTTLSTYSKTEDDDKMVKDDFYVSSKCNDTNSGSKDVPFLTIEKAVEAVRNIDKSGGNGITVSIGAGD